MCGGKKLRRRGEKIMSFQGRHHSNKSRRKMSQSHKGKHFSEETKKRMSKSRTGKNNPFYGKKHTESTKKKISQLGRGRCHTKETKRKISESNKGKIRSQEMRERYSKAKKGLCFSEEHKKHLSENHADFRGEKSSQWLGGISREPYSFEFDKKLKHSIRKRDNYVCQFCGRTEKKNRRALCIHHIDYNKKNSIPQNLISLCHCCNSMVNADRKFWICFFQRKIKKIYKYQNILGVA